MPNCKYISIKRDKESEAAYFNQDIIFINE